MTLSWSQVTSRVRSVPRPMRSSTARLAAPSSRVSRGSWWWAVMLVRVVSRCRVHQQDPWCLLHSSSPDPTWPWCPGSLMRTDQWVEEVRLTMQHLTLTRRMSGRTSKWWVRHSVVKLKLMMIIDSDAELYLRHGGEDSASNNYPPAETSRGRGSEVEWGAGGGHPDQGEPRHHGGEASCSGGDTTHEAECRGSEQEQGRGECCEMMMNCLTQLIMILGLLELWTPGNWDLQWVWPGSVLRSILSTQGLGGPQQSLQQQQSWQQQQTTWWQQQWCCCCYFWCQWCLPVNNSLSLAVHVQPDFISYIPCFNSHCLS